MAGMTDTAFRRLVKRQGGCGLVVTEMVSSEGLVRGIDRTLEYAEYTEEERPVSIQIFGGDPEKMAAAAQIVEGMGADIVDVNMGCPVPKIAKHNAGCSLMREPEHAASVVARDGEGGEDSGDGEDARGLGRRTRSTRRSWRGGSKTPARRRWRCTAGRRRSRTRGSSDWELDRARRERRRRFRSSAAATASSPSRSCERLRDGGVSRRARRPRRAAQPVDLRAGRRSGAPAARRARSPTPSAAQFLLDYIELLHARARCDEAEGLPARRAGPAGAADAPAGPARGHDRWVINKLRALNSWYTKGLDNGSHLRVVDQRRASIPNCAM